MQEPGCGTYTQKLLIITILLMHQLSYVRSRMDAHLLIMFVEGGAEERKMQATLKNTWS